MLNASLKKTMRKVMTVKKVKTKTAIAVALVLLAAGPVVAGFYYYGSKIENLPSFWKKKSTVATSEINSSVSEKNQASVQAGTVRGTCQVCGGKTYCKCECPKKK